MEEMDVIDLRKLVEYSRDKGFLHSMEKRRRVKKDLLKTGTRQTSKRFCVIYVNSVFKL